MQKVLPFSPAADDGGFTSNDEKVDTLIHDTNPAIAKDLHRNPKFPFFKSLIHQTSTNHTSEKKDQEQPAKDIPDQGEEGSSTHMIHITNTNHNFESSMIGLRRQFASQRQIEQQQDNAQDDFDCEDPNKNPIMHHSIQNSVVISLNDSQRKDGSMEDPIKQLNSGFLAHQKRQRSDSQQKRKGSRQFQRNLSKSTMKHSMMSVGKPTEEDLSLDVRQKRRKDAKNIQFLLSMSRSDFVGQSNNNSTIDKTKDNQIKGKSPWQVLGILEAVKTFLENLKNLSTYANGFNSLNNKHLELIDDSAVTYEDPGLSNYLGTFVGGLLSKIPIFSPDSLVIVIWNLLLNIQILVQFVTIPLKICFFLEFNSAAIEIIFFYTPTVIFSMEIFVRLNISYYFEGVLIEDRTKIISHYLFKTYYFWIDLVTTLTFLFSKDINHPLLIFVVLFRFFQFSQLAREIDEHFQISQRFPSVWNLTSLLLIILLLAHFTGCGFHYIAQIQSEQGSYTWLDKANIFDDDWKVQFLYSIYWSSITMITVGYGDIVPITSAEKIYVIIMTLISAGVFAYSINTIGSIFTEHSKKQEALKAQKHDISIYMRNRNISGQLQIETIKYLDYINQEEMEATKRGQGVMQLLSDSIKEKLQTDFYGRIIKESTIFSTYSQAFLQEITQTMKEQLYGPGELIFSQGDLDTRLFFIIKGQVQLFIPRKKKTQPIIISTLEKGEVGHNGFFADQPRGTSFKSLNVSQTVVINKEDFLRILLKYPQDHERFCVIKDSIMQNLQKQRFNCFACGVAGHTILTCQRIHFKKNKWYTIQKFNFSENQPRKKYERKRDTKENTYSNHEHVRCSLLKLRGQKMAQISQIAFDHEGADWLREQKDKTIFQLIPRLVYENNQFALESGNSDASMISDSSDGGIEDLLSDQGSNPEQSETQTEVIADDNRMEQNNVSNKIQSLNEFENQFDSVGNLHIQRESSLVLKPSNFSQEKLQFNEIKDRKRKRASIQNDTFVKNKGEHQHHEEGPMINNFSENSNLKIVQTKNKLLLLTQESNQQSSTHSNDITATKNTTEFHKEQQIKSEVVFPTSKEEGVSTKRTELLKKSKQQLSSESESSNESTSPQRGEFFSILTVDQMKQDNDKQKDPQSALDIPSPLTGPIITLHQVKQINSTSPFQSKESNSKSQNQKKRKSHYFSDLTNNLKIDFSSQNLGETPTEQRHLKSQADDRVREPVSSVVGDSVRNNSNNGSLKQFGDYHSLIQSSQRNKLLKKNSGSFMNLMQRKQELQAHLKNKSHEKQQQQEQQYQTGYSHMAIQKQLSRILEIPVDKLAAPLKLVKIEATPTPLKTVRRQTFTGLFKNSLVEIEQQSSNNFSVALQNSKQMNSLNSIIHSPPMLAPKEFQPQMLNLPTINITGPKQVSQRNAKASRNSISQQQYSQQQQLILCEKSPEAPNQQYFPGSTQIEGQDQAHDSVDTFFGVEDMDCLKNYEIYFPGQNCASVLKGNNAYRQKRLLQKRKNPNKRHSYVSSSSQQNRKHSKFFNLVTNKFNLKKTRTCKGSDFTS